jgi:hypothetical protein
MNPWRFGCSRAGGALALLSLAAAEALAAPITLNDPYQWIENRSTNTLGRAPGLRQSIGVTSVVPNGLAGTTGTATQGSTVLDLPYGGTTAIPNEFSRSIVADPALYGAWQLQFSNGADTASISTPAIDPTLTPMPFATDVRVTHTTTSTFSWSIPAAAPVDAVRINLFDHGRLNLAGTAADIIYNATFAAGTTSFTLPTTLANGLPLDSSHLYTLEINLLDFASNQVTNRQSDLRNRSRLYVDFLPSVTPTIGAFLPVVEPLLNGAPPLFHFAISSVGSSLVYIDPAVATGYEYKIGAGDPNFASVLLPAGIGDGRYTVRLADGQSFDVAGGSAFAFGPGGVSSFTVLGIEPSAGLDPKDPNAFLTGLTFASPGAFTGTMQAVVAVPEMPTWLMFFGGVASLMWVRRRQPARAPQRH